MARTDRPQIVRSCSPRGPNIISFVTELAGFLVLPLALAAARFWWPTIDELEKGSTTLTDLATRTAAALATGNANYLRARKVIFGDRERIVTVGDFCDDAPAEFMAQKGHTDVCKPNDEFSEPVEEILRLL